MVNTVISVRPARTRDAAGIGAAHDASWREAYRGIIPGKELERIVMRRGPRWWTRAIARGSNILVVDFDGIIAGYATYGRNRTPSIPSRGEIFELYLMPEYQGLGFGARLFNSVRSDLARHGCDSVVVWALAENSRACAFYERLGGRALNSAPEKFGSEFRDRIAFAFD